MILRAVIALAAVVLGTSSEALAKGTAGNFPGYDRHAVVTGGSSIGVPLLTAGNSARRERRAKRVYRSSNRSGARVHSSPSRSTARGIVVASSGARAAVSAVAAPRFQCLIGKLEAAGYRIRALGGYARRHNSSAHPTGNALDVDQVSRNRTSMPLPSNATEMANDCGLVHGATWKHADAGHFEMPAKYGYVHTSRRYAFRSARHHRRYAMAR